MLLDQFGMVGLLAYLRSGDKEKDFFALALGTDLTALGLNLNSIELVYFYWLIVVFYIDILSFIDDYFLCRQKLVPLISVAVFGRSVSPSGHWLVRRFIIVVVVLV